MYLYTYAPMNMYVTMHVCSCACTRYGMSLHPAVNVYTGISHLVMGEGYGAAFHGEVPAGSHRA